MHGNASKPTLVCVPARVNAEGEARETDTVSCAGRPDTYRRGRSEIPADETFDDRANERSFEFDLAHLVWALSLPILFVEIGETIVHITNTIFLARVGTPELAAIALGDLIVELVIVPVVGVAEAAQIVIARRLGQRRDDTIGPTFLHMFGLVLLVSIGAAVALRISAPQLAQVSAGSHDAAVELQRFLEIAAFAIVPLALNLAYSSLYVGIGAARVLIGATVALTVTHVGLGYSFIFGAFGFPKLGIRGAAIAFVAAEVVTFVYLTAHALRRLERGRYGLRHPLPPQPRATRSLLRLGGAIGAQAAVETVRWLVFFIIVAHVSERAVAWSNIIYVCYAFFLIPTTAFAESAYTLVSNVIGRGRADRIRWLMRRILFPAYLVTLPFVAVTLIFPAHVLSLFDPGPAAVQGARSSLLLLAVAMLVVIPAEVWSAALFGTGDSDTALGIELGATAIMLAYTYVAAVMFDARLEYVWLALPIASLVTLSAAYLRTRSGRWQQRTSNDHTQLAVSAVTRRPNGGIRDPDPPSNDLEQVGWWLPSDDGADGYLLHVHGAKPETLPWQPVYLVRKRRRSVIRWALLGVIIPLIVGLTIGVAIVALIHS
jgi:putative MATE family efflux protein